MRLTASELRLSPSDLSAFLGCRHRTGLDFAVAAGQLQAPSWTDPMVEALRERGAAHERAYVESLRASGLDIVTIDQNVSPDARVARTLDAMRDGAPVIVQAALAGAAWLGYADVLRRVETPSRLGSWSYEPYDTKLARETRGSTVLQLAVYVDLLEEVQQVRPERFWVVTPGTDPDPFVFIPYRYADFSAYVRVVRRQLADTLALGHDVIRETYYPEPVEQCDVCRWSGRCNGRRRADDHLSFIAGIGRIHREELTAQGYPTLAAAAAMPLPIAFKPSRGSRGTYERIREQARVQHQQRTTGKPVYELLPLEDGQGLARLPEPSLGDLFLDLEGAQFAREGGREYLFGMWSGGISPGSARNTSRPQSSYTAAWAFTDAEERAVFEATIDRIVLAVAEHPSAHVYHYGSYEPAALKRLMGRYATRGEALDELLRGERFVDLHTIVRQSLRAGVERYSIKQLEQYYGYARTMPLADVNPQLQAIELALEGQAPGVIPLEAIEAVQAYNADDCRSAEALRDWLEELRAELMAKGTPIARPQPKPGEASEHVGELEARQHAARARLLEGLSEEAASPDHPDHPRWLLAYLIDWHRRESKSAWWEHYRLRDLPEGDLFDEPRAVAGLVALGRVHEAFYKNGNLKASVDRYEYPAQETELRRGDKLRMPGGERIGVIVAHDRGARAIDIGGKGRGKLDVHPTAVFEAEVIATDVQQEALLGFAADPQAVSCGTDLLFRRPPRLLSGPFAPPLDDEPIVDVAVRLALDLDRTTLAIQGPPGSGKTYAGARMIRALVAAGKKVGVTAVSHKVIRNLLDAVREQDADDVEPTVDGVEPALGGRRLDVEPGFPPPRDVSAERRSLGERGQPRPLRLGQKCDPSEEDGNGAEGPAIQPFTDNAAARAALTSGEVNVLGGTSWLWSREDFTNSVDVIFVDEAGQMSLANALAVSGAASGLVLLGDPQQLEQPQKGTHPDGVGVSALEHVLNGAATMPLDRGVFLPTTWRLHPSICAFTSEVFYEGKLQSKPGLDRQALVGTGAFDGAGLWWIPVEHEGNQNASMEEVDVVEQIVELLLGAPGVLTAPGSVWSRGFSPGWTDEDGTRHPLTATDLRIVAPYNAQVNRLTERLAGHGIAIGTVDKFQGQEAPVVIYSMATSRPEDAARGMEFLYSLNRLNVATSRARCAAIVVGSPKLLEPACRTPRQIMLANALCRCAEVARSHFGPHV